MAGYRFFVPVGDALSGGSTVLFRDDRTFEGAWSHPNVPLLIFKDAKSGTGTVSWNGGPVASGVPVQLVFWGAWWNSADGSDRLAMIEDRVQRTISSPYFSQLSQYGVAPPTFRGSTVIDNPAPPMTFATKADETAVVGLIEWLITTRVLPKPADERIAYIVLMPKGFTETVGANGAHTWELYEDFLSPSDVLWGGFDTEWLWVAWIRFFDPGVEPNDDDPENTNRTISHELAELFTDPQGDGWYAGTTEGEIADAAWSGSTRQTAWVDGAKVSSYWSNAHSATVIPIDRDYAARITGEIEVEHSHKIDEGTFRPEPRDRELCGRVDVCCIEDRDYDWWITGRDEVAWLTLQTHRYRSPIASWSVNGQAVKGSGTVNATVAATRYKARSAQIAQETVAVAFEATDTSLTLRTSKLEVNFDLDVACTVHDGSITGTLQTDVIATPSVTVGFVGSELSLDPEYTRQRDACNAWFEAKFDEVRHKVIEGRPRPGEPVEVGPDVLVSLPAWTRVDSFERARRAVMLSEVGRAVLPREVATAYTELLREDVPDLDAAIAARATTWQRD